MKVIVCKNYEEMSIEAAAILKEQITQKPDSVLGFATGSTPIGVYKRLIEMYERKEIDFKDIKSFNLDEYYPIAPNDPQSYHYFMEENLFNHINIDRNNTHIPDGQTKDPESECDNYEKAIAEHGGVDLQILGIGRNGHIGFNEPGQLLNAKTHLTALTEDTIDANSRFFEDSSLVPTHAITMGIATILSSKKIVLLASGRSKRNVVNLLLSNDITTGNPGSMLKVHHDVTLICDEEAYTEKYIGVDIGGKSIKIGMVENHTITDRRTIKTDTLTSGEAIADAIVSACKDIMKTYDIQAIGVGTPGIIRDDKVSASNVPFKEFPLKEYLSDKLGMNISVQNDAACAALGEQIAGAGAGAKNMLLVTLGTGIGGGIIIDEKIYMGQGASAEVGHICIDLDGLPCSCGSKGCWEQYASAAALEKQAVQAIAENPDSFLAKLYKSEPSAKSVFNALSQGCKTAETVFEKYCDYLSSGLKSLINVFDPESIVISGGISNSGDILLESLKKRLAPFDSIKIATLKNDAGIIGAAGINLMSKA